MVQMKNAERQQDGISSGRYSDEFLDETITVWQPRYPNRQLTREDAREITANLVGFFRVLMKWERKGTSGAEGPYNIRR